MGNIELQKNEFSLTSDLGDVDHSFFSVQSPAPHSYTFLDNLDFLNGSLSAPSNNDASFHAINSISLPHSLPLLMRTRRMANQLVKAPVANFILLPPPLAELYRVYRRRIITDALAVFIAAQMNPFTSALRHEADQVAITCFDHAAENLIWFEGAEYSSMASFNTVHALDLACDEVERRLSFQNNDSRYLLNLQTDDLIEMAIEIARMCAIEEQEFLHQAQQLAEARQDTSRLPPLSRFAYAVQVGDLSPADAWVRRIALAYANIAGIITIPDILMNNAGLSTSASQLSNLSK